MVMVYKITKYGPLITCYDSGFSIREGCLKAKRGRGREGTWFKLSGGPTAEFLWQTRSSRGDYQPSINDEMFMVWFTV